MKYFVGEWCPPPNGYELEEVTDVEYKFLKMVFDFINYKTTSWNSFDGTNSYMTYSSKDGYGKK